MGDQGSSRDHAQTSSDALESEVVERVARAICAHSVSGFCLDVGGHLGCKNGRGVAPHRNNCAANTHQLSLSGLEGVARAAIDAMRQRSAWQPIDSAPTDGTWVNLYWPTMPMSFYPATGFNCGDDCGWQLTALNDYGEVFPTHWVAVLAPPSSASQIAGDSSRDESQ